MDRAAATFAASFDSVPRPSGPFLHVFNGPEHIQRFNPLGTSDISYESGQRVAASAASDVLRQGLSSSSASARATARTCLIVAATRLVKRPAAPSTAQHHRQQKRPQRSDKNEGKHSGDLCRAAKRYAGSLALVDHVVQSCHSGQLTVGCILLDVLGEVIGEVKAAPGEDVRGSAGTGPARDRASLVLGVGLLCQLIAARALNVIAQGQTPPQAKSGPTRRIQELVDDPGPYPSIDPVESGLNAFTPLLDMSDLVALFFELAERFSFKSGPTLQPTRVAACSMDAALLISRSCAALAKPAESRSSEFIRVASLFDFVPGLCQLQQRWISNCGWSNLPDRRGIARMRNLQSVALASAVEQLQPLISASKATSIDGEQLQAAWGTLNEIWSFWSALLIVVGLGCPQSCRCFSAFPAAHCAGMTSEKLGRDLISCISLLRDPMSQHVDRPEQKIDLMSRLGLVGLSMLLGQVASRPVASDSRSGKLTSDELLINILEIARSSLLSSSASKLSPSQLATIPSSGVAMVLQEVAKQLRSPDQTCQALGSSLLQRLYGASTFNSPNTAPQASHVLIPQIMELLNREEGEAENTSVELTSVKFVAEFCLQQPEQVLPQVFAAVQDGVASNRRFEFALQVLTTIVDMDIAALGSSESSEHRVSAHRMLVDFLVAQLSRTSPDAASGHAFTLKLRNQAVRLFSSLPLQEGLQSIFSECIPLLNARESTVRSAATAAVEQFLSGRAALQSLDIVLEFFLRELAANATSSPHAGVPPEGEAQAQSTESRLLTVLSGWATRKLERQYWPEFIACLCNFVLREGVDHSLAFIDAAIHLSSTLRPLFDACANRVLDCVIEELRRPSNVQNAIQASKPLVVLKLLPVETWARSCSTGCSAGTRARLETVAAELIRSFLPDSFGSDQALLELRKTAVEILALFPPEIAVPLFLTDAVWRDLQTRKFESGIRLRSALFGICSNIVFHSRHRSSCWHEDSNFASSVVGDRLLQLVPILLRLIENLGVDEENTKVKMACTDTLGALLRLGFCCVSSSPTNPILEEMRSLQQKRSSVVLLSEPSNPIEEWFAVDKPPPSFRTFAAQSLLGATAPADGSTRPQLLSAAIASCAKVLDFRGLSRVIECCAPRLAVMACSGNSVDEDRARALELMFVVLFFWRDQNSSRTALHQELGGAFSAAVLSGLTNSFPTVRFGALKLLGAVLTACPECIVSEDHESLFRSIVAGLEVLSRNPGTREYELAMRLLEALRVQPQGSAPNRRIQEL